MGKTELDDPTANNGSNWPTWWVLILVFDPQVWRTDAFKEERLKKLEVRQLLSCLKALLGTGREEQRVFFKAALQKNNEVNFTAVEALLFVQVAHELKEVAELAQHQKIINRAIVQDSLVDCTLPEFQLFLFFFVQALPLRQFWNVES